MYSIFLDTVWNPLRRRSDTRRSGHQSDSSARPGPASGPSNGRPVLQPTQNIQDKLAAKLIFHRDINRSTSFKELVGAKQKIASLLVGAPDLPRETPYTCQSRNPRAWR